MKIILTSSNQTLFAECSTWQEANIAAKSIFKRNYWSDLYYSIQFDDGKQVSGSIDLEPVSFHKSQPNSILTTHLRTFWTNITKVKLPHFQITEQDQNYFYSLLQKLTIS